MIQNVNGYLVKRNIVLRFEAVLRFAVPRAAKRKIPSKLNIGVRVHLIRPIYIGPIFKKVT